MNYLVMGPWRHSGVNYDGIDSSARCKWDGDTALQFRRDVLKPFFDQYLKDGAPKADTPPVFIYNTGENHWDRFKQWPLACDEGCAAQVEAALSDRRLRPRRSTDRARRTNGRRRSTSTSPIPAKPVPLRAASGALRRWRRRGSTGC